MTRHEVERLLHCARTEGLGAGPNTLAEVCEWALDTPRVRRSETDAELRAEATEAKLARARDALRYAAGYVHSMHLPGPTTGECSDFVCRLIRDALSDEEPKP